MTKAKRIPAIPTVYNGIKFRSKLEAKYAQAFDIIGIHWVYEEINFKFDDGTYYAPDFFFPNSKQFFEVKGVLTPGDKHKILQLARSGHQIAMGDSSGKFIYFDKKYDDLPSMWELCYLEEQNNNEHEFSYQDGFMFKCDRCHNWVLSGQQGSWECPACGRYDGDHHMVGYLDNIFEEVGW